LFLKLRHAPIADCARYDQLRKPGYGTDPDLRADERTQALWDEGRLRRDHDESASFVVKLMKSFRITGSFKPKPSGGRRHAKLDPHRAFLIARIAEKADITMPAHSAELTKATGTRAYPASVVRCLIRNGYR
jgi:hypothetical protein